MSLAYTSVSDDGLNYLRSLLRLRILTLSHTQVSGTGLKHFHHLDSLFLDHTRVSDAGLAHCKEKGMKELGLLSLDFTHVSDAGLAHLEGLKELDAVYLMGTKLTWVI